MGNVCFVKCSKSFRYMWNVRLYLINTPNFAPTVFMQLNLRVHWMLYCYVEKGYVTFIWVQLESQRTQTADCIHWLCGFHLGRLNWWMWPYLQVSIAGTESSVSSTRQVGWYFYHTSGEVLLLNIYLCFELDRDQ